MEFYKVIEKRDSANEFSSDSINRESLDRIIDATLRSPSWKNNASYKIIFVEDSSLKEKISETLLNDTDQMSKAIKQAPLLAVAVGNPTESEKIENKEYYLVDGAIALHQLVLAATSEGYGTCWLGTKDEEKIKDILQIPKNYKFIGMTPIGRAEGYKPPNPEKNASEHIFLNSFGKSIK